MEQELIKELNKQIIERFEETKKILEERIDSLKSIINNENTNDKLKGNIEIVLGDIESARDKITDEIKRMKKLDDEDRAVFYGEGTFSESDKYEDKITNTINKNEEITKKIDDYGVLKDKISALGNGKVITSVNKNLEDRINKLKTKQGKIAAKQRKIVNKNAERKLKEYLGRINTKDIERQTKIEEKILNNSEKVSEFETERDALNEMKANLLENRSLGLKGLGVKVAFNEKLTQARINGLKAKNGVLKFRNRQMIQANVNKNLIAKMKDKVVNFGKALSNSIKAGVAGFKETYAEYLDSLQEEPRVAPTR